MRGTTAICVLLHLLLIIERAAGQGVIVQSAGPVNHSMGGASVAAPIDSIGAIYWNPASISGMANSETAFAIDVLFPRHTISSSLGGFSGSTEADTGTFPIPNIGWVHRTQNERVTLGLGINTIAGFGTNLPADPTNPILAPVPSGGLGQVASSAMFIQIAPVLAYALSDELSIAAGPTLTTGRIALEPWVLGSANLNGTYSTANATRYHWGGGFQLGTYYVHNAAWRLGASLKSPTWMEEFEANAVDENGMPRINRKDIDLPLILSLGASYAGCEKWLFALDVRYFDYANTDGFGDAAFYDATGALNGLDYSSVMATACGAQYELNDLLTLRAGYTYNQNPIKNSEAFYSIASPLMFQHMLSAGASLNFTPTTSANVAYSYDFENTRTGQLVLPGIGSVPGSTISNTMDAHFLSLGLTIRQ